MKRALLPACLVVISLAVVEVAASLYYFFAVPQQSRALLEPLLGVGGPERLDLLRYSPHPYLNYVFNSEYRAADGFKPYNSRGFRAPEWKAKPPGTVRVVAVGGSTTYGIFSRDGGNIWPAFLESGLNTPGSPAVEVVNLGVTGYTLFEMLGVATMLLPELEPDVVLISAGVNDAFAACYPGEGGPDNTAFRYSWRVRPLPRVAREGMRWSYTLRVLGYLTLSLQDYVPGDLMTAMQFPHPGDAESLRNAAAASGKYFARNLETVVTLVRRMGAEPVVFTQPLNRDWERADAPFIRGVIGAHRLYNDIIRDAGRRAGIAVVDLAAALRAPELFVDAVHPNLSGERLAARLIAPVVADAIASRARRAPAGAFPPTAPPAK